MILSKDTYCSFCGSKFREESEYPKVCHFCGSTIYQNSIPVGVGIVPVQIVPGGNYVGVLTILRQEENQTGKIALPGGYIEKEDWASGISREVFEETGLRVSPPTKIFRVDSTPDYLKMLVFGITGPVLMEDVTKQSGVNGRELRAVRQCELAFPLHTNALIQFWEHLKRKTK